MKPNKKTHSYSTAGRSSACAGVILFLTLIVTSIYGAGLSSARVSQVIQDVRLLPSSAAARPAAVNDNVGIGTAVRTGRQSRAELTFQDLTITRLGENTVFSLKEGTRDLTLDHGSILLQVPAGAPAANIRTAAVTAAVSGGTAIFGTGPPVKFMVMEGVGTFYPAGHPENAVTLHGGEMASLGPDGHLIVQTFDVKLVLETSPLITQFPDLANLPLILQVQDQQQTDQSNPNPPPSKDIIDVTSENTVANPGVNQPPPPPPSGTPGETGPPPTITTPDPYVISSGTTISTDPSITTNGVTDFGTFYRGTALDGTPSEFLFGETPTSFDEMVFSGPQNNLPIAVFKFSNLELTGDPTVSVPSGGATNLALVAVGTITSGGPGGTLTFAGIDRLSFITQDGSITLGSEISFSGIDHIEFYARGSGSNLTLASPISGGSVVNLYSEGSTQVNGDITVSDTFGVITGGDFLAGAGLITATNINIVSLNNININASQFPNPVDNTGSVTLNALNTLNLNLDRGGGFGWNSFDASADTINITGPNASNTFDFSNTSSFTLTAGTGGINAPTIDFVGSPSGGWSLTSGGSISVGSITTENATISAATSFTAAGDVTGAFIGSTLTAGTTVDVGGDLFVFFLTAGGNINVGNEFIASNVNAPSSILTVQGAIVPFGGEGFLQYTYNVDSIVAPSGINFSFNGTPDFVGNLTINSNTLTFDPATGIAFVNFNGVNANEFGSGNPAEGGNGGTFIVNSAGDITANNGADITATTGLNSAPGIYSGAGGTVTLHSTGGMVTVNDTIQVSSDDSEAPRQSASGGTIDLQSDLTTGTGITVGSNGQLLSLLDANAPGLGGSITLSTMGADIVVNGTIKADRGTITIDQSDPASITAPLITIDGATLIADTLSITGAGDINIGVENSVAISAGTISLSAPGLIQVDSTSLSGVNSFDAEAGGATDAGISMSFSDFTDAGDATFQINNEGGTIGSDALVSLTASNLSVGQSETGLFANIDDSFGGSIGGNANVTVNVPGDITTQGDATFQIDNSEGGHIVDGAQISLTAGEVDVGGSLTAFINNRDGGSIGSSAEVLVDITGSLSTQGDATIGISSRNDGAGGGTVGGDATVNVQANSIAIGGFLESFVTANGGEINGDASLIFNVAGDITSGTGTEFDLQDVAYNGSGGPLTPGIIVGDATLSVTAANLTSGGFIEADIFNNAGGHIEGDATLTINTSGDINGQQGILAVIGDTSFAPNLGPSHIDGDAIVTLQAQDIITPSTATGTPGTDTMALEASIYTNVNGVVGGDAIVNVTAAQTISAPGTTLFWIANGNYQNLGIGTIGGNAEVNVNAADISTGDFFFQILNYGGSSIGESALLNLNASNSMTVGALNVLIDNAGGSIGGDATVAITTGGSFSPNTVAAATIGDLTANSLLVQIDNSNGSIGGNATINMNVGGTATTTGDATVVITGNDPTGAAAINFNGGTYNVGGTFLSTIDGNGAINFANANINADTVKAAVFASNGTLMIGGGSLSANTLMKLYATGSNGTIDFTANVTLTCRAAAIILAANTLTINDNVVVTIGGSFPASVYANIANYSGSGGNGSTSGTFAGAGASNPQSLGNAPPFNDPLASATSTTKSSASGSTTVASSGAVSATSLRGHRSSLTDGVKPPTHSVTSANANATTSNTIKVANSGQLLSVLDSATSSSNGKIMIASSKADGVSKSPSGSSPSRPNAAPGLNRSAADKQNSSKTPIALVEGSHPSVR